MRFITDHHERQATKDDMNTSVILLRAMGSLPWDLPTWWLALPGTIPHTDKASGGESRGSILVEAAAGYDANSGESGQHGAKVLRNAERYQSNDGVSRGSVLLPELNAAPKKY